MELGKPARIRKRFYRNEPSPQRILLLRLAFVAVLLLLVAGIFWVFERDDIEDSHDGDFSYVDSLYFTIVTVTTLGYGDIVPVTPRARLVDALVVTPVRIIVWVLFIGTAYQLVIQRYLEMYRMNRALKRMKGHVIIAGFGTTGASAVEELLHKGYDENSIIVIERDEEKVKEAADKGATGLLGDPSSEELLSEAGVKDASVLIITTPHDDSNVLITLTAKDLNPKLHVISRVKQKENIKQLERAGADLIISPSLTSGNLMAMGVVKTAHVKLIGDLLTSRRGSNVHQRKVKPEEVGRNPKNLKGFVVIGVVSGGKNIGPAGLDSVKLKKGDEIIIIG